MKNIKTRAENALMGLAIGDAIGWSAMYHRSLLLPQWTRRLRREIEINNEEKGVTTPAFPFSLNRDAAHFLPGPTDDTEWAVFSALVWMENQSELSNDALNNAWLDLTEREESVRGKASVMAALNNFNKGLLPPVTGHDNPSYFDDAAVSRAVPIGVLFSGEPEEAVEVAKRDAAVTNAEDGIYAAQAMAIAISCACSGQSVEEVIKSAIAQFPDQSWISDSIDLISRCKVNDSSMIGSVIQLSEQVVNREYHSGCVAVETLTMALCILKLTMADFETGVMAATLVAKTADSLPAFVGALCGASTDRSIATPYWQHRLAILKGICIPSYQGKDFIKIVDALATVAVQKNATND